MKHLFCGFETTRDKMDKFQTIINAIEEKKKTFKGLMLDFELQEIGIRTETMQSNRELKKHIVVNKYDSLGSFSCYYNIELLEIKNRITTYKVVYLGDLK